MIKVKSGRYDFFINGRQIFVRDAANGTMVVKARDDLELTQYQYAQLVDDIYRRKIIDTNGFIKCIYSTYKIIHTSRKLPK